MPLIRTEHWATRELHQFLQENKNITFKWGVTDCGLFAADAIKSFTGVDIAADFRGKYTTQIGAIKAFKTVAGGTTIADAAAHCAQKNGLTEHTHCLMAKRGDLVLLQNAGQLIAGIVHLNGRAVVSVSEKGILSQPITTVKRSWSV